MPLQLPYSRLSRRALFQRANYPQSNSAKMPLSLHLLPCNTLFPTSPSEGTPLGAENLLPRKEEGRVRRPEKPLHRLAHRPLAAVCRPLRTLCGPLWPDTALFGLRRPLYARGARPAETDVFFRLPEADRPHHRLCGDDRLVWPAPPRPRHPLERLLVALVDVVASHRLLGSDLRLSPPVPARPDSAGRPALPFDPLTPRL